MSESESLDRFRAEHESIRLEIAQLTLFLSVNINRHYSPKTYAAIERIVAAWTAAESA